MEMQDGQHQAEGGQDHPADQLRDGHGEGGQGEETTDVVVNNTVYRIESEENFRRMLTSTPKSRSKFVIPRRGKGIKRDGLIQTRMDSLTLSVGGCKYNRFETSDPANVQKKMKS